MALFVTTDGSISEVLPKNKKSFTLEEMQTLINGYIELVKVDKDISIIVDEDGLLKKLRYNDTASKLAGFRIVGSALICDAQKEVK